MSFQPPNIDWYLSKSKIVKLSPRCPIASSELCPRYYASLRLLGSVNFTTAISQEDQIRLDKKWNAFQPVICEEGVAISYDEHELSSIRRFCPNS